MEDKDLSDEYELSAELFQLLVPFANWESDPHLQRTPERFCKMVQEVTTTEPFVFTKFESASNEMVVVQDIPFYTFCAHHMLPFHGRAHVAYVPQGWICGLSKVARTVKMFASDLNVQEELTNNICEYLEAELEPLGVGVVMQAEHLCMTMRGVQVPGTLTTTSAMRGCFLDPEKGARQEFLQLIAR